MINDTEINDQNNKTYNQRENDKRKRINRIKTTIIIIAIFLILLPTILCVLLGLQLNRLQQQINELSDFYNNSQQTDISEEESNLPTAEITMPYAYANPWNILRYSSENIGLPLKNNNTYNLSDRDDEAEEWSDINSIFSWMPKQAVQKQDVTEQGSGKHLDNTADPASDMANNDSGDRAMDKEAEEEQDKLQSEQDMLSAEDQDKVTEDESEKATKKGSKKDSKKDSKPQKETETRGIYYGKTVYLTFDDGPSENTAKILDILKEYDVKATFFVIGYTDKASKELYQRIVDEGHTLGMHSYSHKYDVIYNSIEDFDKDFTKLWKLLYDTTGYEPSIYRFPGGSGNKVNKHGMEQFIKYLNDKSIVYYDWNVLNGDATGVNYTKEQLINNVLDGVAVKKRSIVLMHDSQSKKKTVETLPKILDALIAGGAEILPLDNEVSPIQMIKADSIE